jgi:hypothetical protein
MTSSLEPAGPGDGNGPAIESLGGLFLIMFARAAGYAALLILTVVIARRAQWSFSAADVLFWLCAVAIPLARQRVAARYEANSGAGAPASLARGLLVHLGLAAPLWIGAHSIHFV